MIYLLIKVFIIILLSETSLNHNDLDNCMLVSVLNSNIEYTYQGSARYDNVPSHYVSDICNTINGAPEGTSILGRVVEGVNASAGPRVIVYTISNQVTWMSGCGRYSFCFLLLN